MKKTPQRQNFKNYHVNFNIKDKTSPVKIRKNSSSSNFVFSEINLDYPNPSRILMKNELFPMTDPFKNSKMITKKEQLKKYNQTFMSQILQKKDKSDSRRNLNSKKNLSTSKNHSYISIGNKIISIESLIKANIKNMKNIKTNKNDKNYKLKNANSNRVKQYDAVISEENQKQDIEKHFKKKIIPQKETNKSNKTSKEKNKNKIDKEKQKINSATKIKNINYAKNSFLSQLCLDSNNRNSVNFENQPKYAKTNSIWNYSMKKNITSSNILCDTNFDDNNLITDNKSVLTSKSGFMNMNDRYNFQNRSSMLKVLQRALISNKFKKNINTDLNHYLYYKKAVEILELFLRKKYFYYLIKKFLFYFTKNLPNSEINLYSPSNVSSSVSINNITSINGKFFLPQLLYKESVNSFILENNNSKKNKMDMINLENKLKEVVFENKKTKIKNDILIKDNQRLLMKIENFIHKKPFNKLDTQNVNELCIKNIRNNSFLVLKKIALNALLIIINNRIKFLLYQAFNQFYRKVINSKKCNKEDIEELKKKKLKKIIINKEKYLHKNFMEFYFKGLIVEMKKYEYNFINGGRLIDINNSSYFNKYNNNGIKNTVNKLVKLRELIYNKKNKELKIVQNYFKIFLANGIHQEMYFQIKHNNLNINNNVKEKCFMEELIKGRNLMKKILLKKLIINKDKNVLIIFKSIFKEWNLKAKLFGMIELDKAKKKKRRIRKRINKKNTKIKCYTNNESPNINNKNNRQINAGNSLISTAFSNNYELSNLSKLKIFIQKLENIFNSKIHFYNLMKKIYENKHNKNYIKENEKSSDNDDIDFDIADSSLDL